MGLFVTVDLRFVFSCILLVIVLVVATCFDLLFSLFLWLGLISLLNSCSFVYFGFLFLYYYYRFGFCVDCYCLNFVLLWFVVFMILDLVWSLCVVGLIGINVGALVGCLRMCFVCLFC